MKKRIALLLAGILLITSMLTVFSGCKKNDEGLDSGDTSNNSIVSDEEKVQYNREPEDLGGFELDLLTVESGTWKMHTDIAPTTYNGETINAAVYERNERVQEQYNAKIVAHEDAEYYHLTERLSRDLLSGEYLYDAAYVEGSSVTALVTSDSLKNLYEVPEIQLDQQWWSQLVKKEATLGSGKYSSLYFTQSNLSLTAFDLTWCVYFNKDAHEKNQLEDIYSLVREGKWTIEKMRTMAHDVASLNADNSFSYNADGTAFYGITTYWNGVKAFLDGGNIQFVVKNPDGDPTSNISNERSINLAQSLARMFGEPGTFTTGGPSEDGSTHGNAEDYIKIFNAGRAFFCVAEVKSSVKDFNTYSGDFGIVPMPMYDELQKEYRSWVNYLAPVLVIPSTASSDNLHKTALLLDVLSFYSDRDVLPQYYDTVLKGRGAKDSESVEMLDLINQTKSFDASIAYGWSRQYSEVLSNTIQQGIVDISSIVASYDGLVENIIKDYLTKLYKD